MFWFCLLYFHNRVIQKQADSSTVLFVEIIFDARLFLYFLIRYRPTNGDIDHVWMTSGVFTRAEQCLTVNWPIVDHANSMSIKCRLSFYCFNRRIKFRCIRIYLNGINYVSNVQYVPFFFLPEKTLHLFNFWLFNKKQTSKKKKHSYVSKIPFLSQNERKLYKDGVQVSFLGQWLWKKKKATT